MIVFLLVMEAVFVAVGFGWGRLEEWRRTLRYLHAYEDAGIEKPTWWLAAGIAADEHWKRSSLPVDDASAVSQ